MPVKKTTAKKTAKKRTVKKIAVAPATISDISNLIEQVLNIAADEHDGLQLIINEYGMSLTDDNYNINHDVKTLDEARTYLQERLEELKNTPKIVRVGNYDARVSGEGIHVGCTTVTFAQFDALAEEVATFLERELKYAGRRS